MDPKVLFLDDLIGVVVKPTMLMVEPDRLGNPNLQDWAENEWGGKSWAVHRLDRPTSGLVVLARKKKSCTHLMQQFEMRVVRKKYRFKTHVPLNEKSWNWEDYLKKDPINFKSVIVSANEGKRAFLSGNRIGENIGEVEPKTGRYHQIRIQSSKRGYPILGDVHYGGKEWENKGIALHASFLSFRHPRNEEIMNFENLSDRF